MFKDMSGMFQDCNSLQFIIVLNFYTSKVTSMEKMFKNCQSINTVEISSFILKKLKIWHKYLMDGDNYIL